MRLGEDSSEFLFAASGQIYVVRDAVRFFAVCVGSLYTAVAALEFARVGGVGIENPDVWVETFSQLLFQKGESAIFGNRAQSTRRELHDNPFLYFSDVEALSLQIGVEAFFRAVVGVRYLRTDVSAFSGKLANF